MTLAIAIYAAVVATGGVTWQVYTWLHGRRPHVNVTVRIAYTIDAAKKSQAWLVVTAISRTNHPIRTTNAGFRADSLQDKIAWCLRPHELASIPGVIPPHDSAEAFLDVPSLVRDGVDLNQPIRACVKLSTDELVWSKPTVVGDQLA